MYSLDNAVSIKPPLKGSYFAGNSPLQYKSSHKSDLFGQTYAIDLLQTKENGFFKPWQYLNFLYMPGLRSSFFRCWGNEIYAPFSGAVVDMQKNAKDSLWNNIPLMPVYKFQYKQIPQKKILRIRRLFPYSVEKIAFPNEKSKYEFLNIFCGNYILLKMRDAEVYAFFGHIQADSIAVEINQEIGEGEKLGRIGNTGNSQAPHLHFHLCDSKNLWKAKGIPFTFEEYQVKNNGAYMKVKNSIPNIKEELLL